MNNSRFCILSVMWLWLSVGIGCKKQSDINSRPCPSCPIISAITPTEGDMGDTVRLEGKNFSPYPERNHVYIGDTKVKTINYLPSEKVAYIQIPENCESGEVIIKINDDDLVSNVDAWVLSHVSDLIPYFTYKPSIREEVISYIQDLDPYQCYWVSDIFLYLDSTMQLYALDLQSDAATPKLIADLSSDFGSLTGCSDNYVMGSNGSMVFSVFGDRINSSGSVCQYYSFDATSNSVKKVQGYARILSSNNLPIVDCHFLNSDQCLTVVKNNANDELDFYVVGVKNGDSISVISSPDLVLDKSTYLGDVADRFIMSNTEKEKVLITPGNDIIELDFTTGSATSIVKYDGGNNPNKINDTLTLVATSIGKSYFQTILKSGILLLTDQENNLIRMINQKLNQSAVLLEGNLDFQYSRLLNQNSEKLLMIKKTSFNTYSLNYINYE